MSGDARISPLRVVELPLRPLSQDAFAPFGRIIGDQDAPPVFAAPHLCSWRLDFTVDGPAELMATRYVHEPFELTALERHLAVSQAFIPLGGAASVMVVAAPTDPGDPEAVPAPGDVRAFLVPGTVGIMLWRGTWHALSRFPVPAEGALFALLTGAETQRELEREKADGTPPALTHVVDYAMRDGLGFRVVDPDRLLAGL